MSSPRIEVYPLNDFCSAYGIGRTKAYEEMAAGRLKARKVGARTVILAADAQAWADQLPVYSRKDDADA